MGKVHGSLARAGKVRSATPKVLDFHTHLKHIITPPLYDRGKPKLEAAKHLKTYQGITHAEADIENVQVEPQEKKKTPKGRAKKRLTYTRRFVNVTMMGGKRKVLSPALV